MGAPLNTQSAGGIDALRDHDPSSPLETRSVRWAVTHGGYDQYGNRKTAQKGDINCATWWPAASRASHGWAFAWPVLTGEAEAFQGFTYVEGARGPFSGFLAAAGPGAGKPGGGGNGGGAGGGAGAINAATGVGSNSFGNIGGWAGVGEVGSFIGLGPGGSQIVGTGSFFGGAGQMPGVEHVGVGSGGSQIVRVYNSDSENAKRAAKKAKGAGAGGEAGPEGSPGNFGKPGGAAPEVTGERNSSGDAAHGVSVTPIQNATYGKDVGFTTQSMIGRFGWPKIPQGTVGVVIAGTYDKSQLPVFIHGDPRLLAINDGADPAMGSSVCDPYGFSARMQSAWRVVSPLTTRMPAGSLNALAWQLCRTKRERNAGYGLFVDEPDKQSRGSGTTTKSEGSFSGANIAREKPKAGAGGSVPVGLRAPSDVASSGSNDDEAGLVVACASARVGGPLDVGHGRADKHDLGMSGERHVNAGHIRYEALFYWDKEFDAPLEFQKRYYPKTEEHPNKSKVHLVYDPDLDHQYGDFKAKGKWRWYAEVPYTETPKDDKPPRRPPPTTGPPATGEPPDYPYPAPGVTNHPTPSQPTTGVVNSVTHKTKPKGGGGGGGPPGGDGPPGGAGPGGGGSGGGGGAGVAFDVVRPWAPGQTSYQRFVSWPGMVGFNGQLFRPAQMAAGLPDLRGVASVPASYSEWAEATRPVVVRMEPFGAESTSGQWVTQSGTQRYPFGTGQGGILFMPPQVDLFDTERASGLLPTQTAPYVAVWGAWWGAGTPSRTTGLLKSGFRWGVSGTSLVFDALDASSAATTGIRLKSDGTPGLRESGGTILDLAGIADGQYLKRSGSTITSGTPAASIADGDYGDIVVSGGGTVWSIDAGVVDTTELAARGVTAAKLFAIAQDRILGRITAGSGDVEVLTGTQAATILPAFTGDSGAGGVKGQVPAPAAGDGAARYALLASGSFGITRGILKEIIEYDGNVSGTYAPSAGVTAFLVEVTGAGAGGGGADSTGAAGGGGAGGFAAKWYGGPTLSTYAYQGRAGGAGGTAGPNAGSSPAGATTFDTISVPASNGGGSMTTGTAATIGVGGAASAIPTGGDINIKGAAGFNGFRFSAAILFGGQGAASTHGGGGQGATAIGAVGGAAEVPGAGGGGATAGGGTDRAGGDGGGSRIRIYAFY